MQNYKQPLLTILVIFAAAYILTMLGCAKGGNDLVAGQPAPQVDTPKPADKIPAEFQPVDVKTMRECTAGEWEKLSEMKSAAATADATIKKISSAPDSWKKDAKLIELATAAIKKCDVAINYHYEKPCKKMIIPKPGVKDYVGYDASRIQKRCEVSEKYLVKFNLRPAKPSSQTDTPVVRPTPAPTPSPSPTPTPSIPDVAEPIPSNLRQCSPDEFAKLKSWRMYLDLADKNIAKLGTALKYEPIAIDAATTATKQCETLIAYHNAQPCAREKAYTVDTLKASCKNARAYYYDFAQRAESLITPNAKLYLDTSAFAHVGFRTGKSEFVLGQCIFENETGNTITLPAGKVLLIEANVYPSVGSSSQGSNIAGFKTAEGLDITCYGLEYTSAKTSKSEVVRLLRAKDTKINLFYELN